MPRKRLTQILPFLLPIRIWQRNLFSGIKMRFDKNKYSKKFGEPLKYEVCGIKTLIVNENSGHDIIYQHNKAHNLKITAKTMDGLLIRPGETFSFSLLSKNSRKYGRLKDGLILVDGKIKAQKGGGTCHLSNMLYQMFLMSPLTVTERHSHKVKSFPDPDGSDTDGIDATICEGWLDLQVKNNTYDIFQIKISFDDKYMCGKILSNCQFNTEYKIINENTRYLNEGGNIYKYTTVSRVKTDKLRKKEIETEKLYDEKILIAYRLPDNIIVNGGKELLK